MLTICKIYFVSLLTFSVSFFILSLDFMIMDYSLIIEWEVLSLNSSPIYMVILLDWMSLLFMSFVLFISCMVIFYSEGYMEGDFNISRFIIMVCLFVLSMMLLIISPNLISILLGWDGLGLVSYCLVIYYQNEKSYNAGMLTALSNRIGDVALLMGIAWMMNYGSWNFYFYVDFLSSDYDMEVISFLVVLAAMTKSAQIPFSSWLPAAMAAPTPVSSLVHSSTLVTAGVYLLIRFSSALGSNLSMILLFISSMTMFMAGIGANFEFDLKKIIALSTLSQLGLMMGILSIGEPLLAFFHLLTHALFKALLFMCAGVIIHNLCNCQDIRYMGSLSCSMPLVFTMFNISNFALCGLPFLAGFYSKDLMLEVLSMSYLNIYIYIIFFISTGLTVCYSVRLFYYTSLGDYNFISLSGLNEEGYLMIKGMLGLIGFVVVGGSMLMWTILSTPVFICLPSLMKMMTLLVISIGAWAGYECSVFNLNYGVKSLYFKNSSLFFASMWNMPFMSTYGINYYPLVVGNYMYKYIDQGWSELLGAQNIFYSLKRSSQFSQLVFSNNLKVYLLLMFFWLVFLLIMLI